MPKNSLKGGIRMNEMQKFMATLDSNLGYKTAILPLLPKGKVNILDFGGGTGVLSNAIKLSNPEAHVAILDINEEMLATAKQNNTADFYCNSIESLPHQAYDAIVLCSVLHELKYWRYTLKNLQTKLRSGGILVIRDGMRSRRYSYPRENGYSVKLRNPEKAKQFFEKCEAGSLISKLSIYFEEDYLVGDTDDVRSFLQTYTWGEDALEREQHENHLFASVNEIKSFLCDDLEYNPDDFKATEICQQNYFKHLDKLIEVEEMWNTHMIITSKKY